MGKKISFYRQLDTMDCGPACIKMICGYHGKDISIQELRKRSHISREGVSINGIIKALESLGFRAISIKIPTIPINEEASLFKAPLPCIAHWRGNHFVVISKVSRKYIWIADPASGIYKLPIEKFRKAFENNGKGFVVIVEPTPDFYNEDFPKDSKLNFRRVIGYFRPYKKQIIQLFIGILASILLQLIFPFLTQAIIDIGINTNDLTFIIIIIISQLVVFIFSSIVNILQRWIILHINTRISVQLIYDFLLRLMELPMSVFRSKHIGDLYQRIQDNRKVESFLTNSIIPLIQGSISLIVFGIVLLIYNKTIFFVYLLGLLSFIFWIVIFMKKRATIDYIQFLEASKNQNTVLELLRGMQEIKLQNSEIKRRNEWLSTQAKLFHINMKGLKLTNFQDFGGQFINRFKDIFIVFICALEVMNGTMTLGMFLAVQYIVGRMNAPLLQMTGILRSWQDAMLSLKRMNDLYFQEKETNENLLSLVFEKSDLILENIYFKYNELSDLVLKDINISIPYGQKVAIVGASGSGKTTLVKLLLGIETPSQGQIFIGDVNIKMINKSQWRRMCGVVMQEGFIFSDSIANNIAESDDFVDEKKLLNAVKVANIQSYIEKLPLAYNTKIGFSGNGISNGQRQRILIARAIYKNPHYLFFDEATNALDANNEKIIIENLEVEVKNKTVIIVAHRLSTVKNADIILVLDKGEIVERGNHQSLIQEKGYYYSLIKNQLELGN